MMLGLGDGGWQEVAVLVIGVSWMAAGILVAAGWHYARTHGWGGPR